MTAAEQAPHPRAGPAQAASNQPVSSSVEIDKTPQFHWVDIDPLPPSSLYSNRRRAKIRVFEIPASTSSFTPGDQAAARKTTGIYGDPAILWVGHLNANKDPLTVLDGVSKALRELPDLQLWCCYASAPLLSAVQARLKSDSALRDHVHLRGRVPHDEIEQFMRAADVFVLGSHREGCNFSVMESLATGLAPVVTDIASMQALTSAGRIGELWTCGDSDSCADALLRAAGRPAHETRIEARRYFDDHLSSRAIGRRFAEAYTALLSGNVSSGHCQLEAASDRVNR